MSYDKNKPSEYDGIFQQAADKHGVSYDLLRKLAFNESSFNPRAKSKTGPIGIMQFTKATGKAMGLRITGGDDDDRYNPELAIDAAARHLAQLTGKFNGDELKAALAYNQGEGRLGAAQLQAYDKGDFAAISEEGRNYMRKLTDVVKSDRLGDFEAFGGITPKGKGIPADVAFKGIEKEGKVGTELPESTGFKVEGKVQEDKAIPFAKSFWETHGTTLDEYEERSTFFGIGDATKAELHNSFLGAAFRAARVDNSFDVFTDVLTPTKWNSYVPSQEDLQKLKDSGLPASYYHVVTGGEGENWDELIEYAKKNYEKDAKAAEAGLGAKLAAGVVGAGVDPLSYVPLVGVSGKGIKVVNKAFQVGAQSAVIGMASEGLRTSVAGGEANYQEAALSGMLFGAGMSAISDAVSAGLRKAGKAEVANEFAGMSTRLEARETALNSGGEDLTRMPTENRVFDKEYRGVKYSDHPVEEGAVVLDSGIILSDTNPLNPKTLKEFSELNPERAAAGIQLGGFTEVGLKTLRSESPEVRALASDLVRSPTGMESGTSGKFGATASDIIERERSQDLFTYNKMYDAVSEAMKEPQYSVGMFTMNRRAIRQDIYKKAALAIERPELQKDLSKAERKVLDIMKQHFDRKRELMENPTVFGNEKAVSIFPESRHVGTYVPHVYDKGAKALMLQRLGSDGLQEAIAESWLLSYRSRPEVKARVDEMLMETGGLKSAESITPDMVRKYAMDKAYGISHSNEFTLSSVAEENLGTSNHGLQGIENNKFLEARNLFDSDMEITLPDGSLFSVNDLRNFDMATVIPAYDRRVNGDIAIMGGTGKTTAQLKDEILALRSKFQGEGKKSTEADALGDIVKLLTGRARRNQDTVFETAMRSLSDMAFFTKNAYMGAQNLTEIAGMVAKGNVRAMLHGIPMINDLAFRKAPVSGKELKELHGFVFGKELDDLIRPRREDIAERMREFSSASDRVINTVSTLKFATQELAARSPWTKMLNGTSNYLLDAARQGVLADVAGAALAGKTPKFGKENFLKSASISKEQWEGMKQLFIEHASRDESGKFNIKNKEAFAADPRAMDLWRLADKVADETMLRPHKVSSQDVAAYSAGIRMMMQFKNFTIKSLNSRFIRSFYEGYKNNRVIDQALTHIVSMGLAGGFYVASAHLKASSLPEGQQADYLKRALNPTMIGYASLSRSSHTGAPLSMMTMLGGLAGIDEFKMLRTSILPKEEQAKKDKPLSKYTATHNIGGSLAEQVPAIGVVGAAVSAGSSAIGALTAPTRATELDYMSTLMNSTRELVPNDPLTQQLVIKIYEANGVHTKELPKAN